MQPSIINAIASAPGKLARNINRFFFEQVQVNCKPLVFFRISIGLLVLLHFLCMFQDVNLLFGSKSLLPPEVSSLYTDEFVISNNLLRSVTGMNPEIFNLLFNSAYIFVALCIISGLYTRYAACIMLLLHTALLSSNVFFMYGADYFIRMSLFYLIIFPTDHSFSVSALLKRKHKSGGNYLIYLRFLQVHLLMVYLFSGAGKIIGYNWRNGEAIWKAVNLPHANNDFKLGFAWMTEYPLIATLMGWSILVAEIGYPLIFVKKLRSVVLFSVVLMHLGIALVLNLYFFAAVMIVWNLAAFLDFDKKFPAFHLRSMPGLRQPV